MLYIHWEFIILIIVGLLKKKIHVVLKLKLLNQNIISSLNNIVWFYNVYNYSSFLIISKNFPRI